MKKTILSYDQGGLGRVTVFGELVDAGLVCARVDFLDGVTFKRGDQLLVLRNGHVVHVHGERVSTSSSALEGAAPTEKRAA